MHLKYNGHSKSLRLIAFQQLIEKNLIRLGDTRHSPSEISKIIAKSIGVKNVDTKHVKDALIALQNDGRAVVAEDGNWALNPKIKQEINDEIQYFDKEFDYVVNKHFPSLEIGKKAKKEWFTRACAEVFGKYGDLFISAIANRDGFGEVVISDVLETSINESGLEDFKNILVQGFTSFIYSQEQREQSYLQNVAMAMVATKVVAANIGADLVSLESLKGVKFLADTNVLISLALEKNLDSAAIATLVAALTELDIKISYIPQTKDEYDYVLSAAATGLMRVVDRYSVEVLWEDTDDFMRSALRAGARTHDEFQAFFDSLKIFPPSLPGYEIMKEEDDKTEEAAIKSTRNNQLIDKIKDLSLSRLVRSHRTEPRKDRVLLHDVALISVAKFLRDDGESCVILTTDSVIKRYSINYRDKQKLPLVISFETLIDLLAIHSGGLSVKANNFAPLLAKVILNRCLPSRDSYKTQDLQALADANQKVTDMAPHEIREVLKETRHYELAGGKNKDKISLAVDRILADKHLHEQNALEKTIKEQEQENTKLVRDSKRLKLLLKRQKAKNLHDRIAVIIERKNKKSKSLAITAGALLGVVLIFAYYFLFTLVTGNTLLSAGLAILADSASLFKLYFDLRSWYEREKNKNDIAARNEAEASRG